MKNPAAVFIIFSFLLCCNSYAQTKIIALKSHSGNIKELSLNGSDDFGNAGMPMHYYDTKLRLKRVTKLSDTSAEEEYGVPGSNDKDEKKIVYHHYNYNNPFITVDSLRKIYPGVWFSGFDKKAPVKTQKLQPVKKKSGLLFFFPSDNDDNNRLLFGLGIFIFTAALAFFMWKNQKKRWRLSLAKQ